MPKISVIMPVYNSEKTVGASIDSILNQTFQDFEIIICDDASTDESYEVIKQYEEKHPKTIKILKNVDNLKSSATSNKCIDVAKGDYIARMDADDISLPNRLEKQMRFLEERPEYDFVGCSIQVFDDNAVWGMRSFPEYPAKKELLWNLPFCHATTMFRADALRKVGCYRVEKITRRCEDMDLFLRMYAAGMKGYNIQEVLFKVYEGRGAYRRRKYRFRFDEVKVRYHGFKALGLMPKAIPYVIKPLIVGLLPMGIVKRLRGDSRDNINVK